MVEVETRLAEDFQADNMGIGLGLRTLVERLGQSLLSEKKVYPTLLEAGAVVLKDVGKYGTDQCWKRTDVSR